MLFLEHGEIVPYLGDTRTPGDYTVRVVFHAFILVFVSLCLRGLFFIIFLDTCHVGRGCKCRHLFIICERPDAIELSLVCLLYGSSLERYCCVFCQLHFNHLSRLIWGEWVWRCSPPHKAVPNRSIPAILMTASDGGSVCSFFPRYVRRV